MPRVPLGERRSARHRTKTGSGCLTCKKRRIKCDEAKPNCLKCSSTGRKCDGYEAPHRNAPLRLPFLFPPNLTHSGSERETRSFQFFYERTVPSLTGYCGSEFWSRLVLQVSQHEESVWHALIALGSLHENFEKDQQIPGFWFARQGQDRFAVQEYVAAIRALLRPSHSSSCDTPSHAVSGSPRNLTVDVCLISCILFACFEILSSHYVSAIDHVRSGMRILGEVHYDPSSGTYRHPFLKPSTVTSLEMENLRKILTRLQGQALILTRAEIDKPLFNIAQTRGTRYAEVPHSFSSIAEAHDIFEYHSCRLFHEFHDLIDTKTILKASDTYADLLQQYASLLEKWSVALDRFEQYRGQLLTNKERKGLKILRIHGYKQFIPLDHGRLGMTDMISWDTYNSIFEQIISLAASVVDITDDVESPSDPSKEGRLKPSFSLDMGIIAPLYDVATLCRDPSIRRRAVNVLRSASRQEGLFNSHVCAVIAGKVISLEESVASGGSLHYQKDFVSLMTLVSDAGQQQLHHHHHHHIKRCSEVPDTARLSYAYPKFDTVNKKVSLTIGQATGMHMKIPLPAMTAMLDMEK